METPFDRAAWTALAQEPGRSDHGAKIIFGIERLNAGGAERQLCRSAVAARDLGLDVEIVMLRPLPDEGRALAEMLDRAGIGLRMLPAAECAAPSLPAGWSVPVQSLTAYFRDAKPAAVIAFMDRPNLFFGFAALAAGVPAASLSVRNVAPVNFPHFFAGQTDDFRDGYMLLNASPRIGFTANSAAGAQSYAQWLDWPQQRFTLIGNLPGPVPPPVDKDIDVLGVFRLSAEKAPLRFVETIAALHARFPKLKAVLAGDGPLRVEVSAAISAHGLEHVLQIPGHVSEIADLIGRARLLLHTAPVEGTPNILQEAQAAGLPCVAVAAPGSLDALCPQLRGLARQAGDVVGLADVCAELLSDPSRAAVLGREAASFTPDRADPLAVILGQIAAPDAAVAAAEKLRRSGRAKAAAQLLEQAARRMPAHVGILNHLGLARRSACDPAGALRAFAAAAQAAPQDRWAETNMAFSLLRHPPDPRAAFADLAAPDHGDGQGLGLFCDRFPHTYGFLLQQFQTYLRTFPDSRAYSYGRKVLDPYGVDQFGQAFASWKAAGNEDIADRVHQLIPCLDVPGDPGRSGIARVVSVGGFRRPALAHNIFAMNAGLFLPLYETLRIPFTFTLNPGGGFRLDDPESDFNLRRVFESPMFRNVIVTYDLTRRYILDRFGVPEDRITLLPGTIVVESLLNAHRRPKRRFGRDKDTLDVCFGGLRYTPLGTDKGYDRFIAAAHRLAGRFPHLHFHVFGDYHPDLIDVSGLAGRIHFYGMRNQAWLAGFYSGMDAMVSPNIPDSITKGAFDGFPVTTCIEAGMCGTALFASDPMDLNFALTDGVDYVSIDVDPVRLADCLEAWLADPDRLYALAAAGETRFHQVWGEAAQMGPRAALMREWLGR